MQVVFAESELAHRYLDGLVGVEIGAAAHNPFGLDTWNIDRWGPGTPHREMYDLEQIELCGTAAPVDLVARGDVLPLRDGAVDFVVASHVIEHFWDPIAALDEWARVARSHLVLICPQRDALPEDADRPLTTLAEHRERHRRREGRRPGDDHHSRWTSASFHRMCEAFGYDVVAIEDPDMKAANGFMVIIDLTTPAWRVRLRTAKRRVLAAPDILRRRLAR